MDTIVEMGQAYPECVGEGGSKSGSESIHEWVFSFKYRIDCLSLIKIIKARVHGSYSC